MTGERFGPYLLESVVSRVGVGELYRAFDTTRERNVAVWRLAAAFRDAAFDEQFRQACGIAARLREPHIIPIHDFGEIDECLFVDMRLVDGNPLSDLLASGRVRPEHAVDIVSQIADALDAAHAEGLVHRDLCPENVLLAGMPQDFVYLVNFGLVDMHVATVGAGAADRARSLPAAPYAAPERYTQAGCDHRVDVYALACVLHEILTGSPPDHDRRGPSRAGQPAPPTSPAANGALLGPLVEVVVRGLAEDPGDRYPHAGELAAAARAGVRGPPSGPLTRVPPGPRPPQFDEVLQTPTQGVGGAPSSLPHVDPPTAPSTRRWRLLAGGTALVLALVTSAALLLGERDDVAPPPPPPPPPNLSVRETVIGQIGVGERPDELAISPDGRWLYVANTASDTVSVIDCGTGTVSATIPTGDGPRGLAISPDGTRLFATDFGSNDLSVIATDSRQVTATVPSGAGAKGVALSPDGRRAYVSNLYGDTLSVIDTGTNAVAATVAGGDGPASVVLSPDGRTAYVTNVASDSLSVIDTASNRITATLPAGTEPERVAISPDGSRLYVTSSATNAVAVIDTTSQALIATTSVGLLPLGLSVSPDAARVYVANAGSGTLSVLDSRSNTVIRSVDIPAGRIVVDVVISPDGRRAYASTRDTNAVTVIEIS